MMMSDTMIVLTIAGINLIVAMSAPAIFRMFWVKLIELIGAVIGSILFPFIIYPLRKFWLNFPTFSKLFFGIHWLMNSSEGDYVNNWYGVYELIDGEDNYEKFDGYGWIRRFFIAYRWYFRNPAYDLKLLLGRHVVGEKSNIKAKGGGDWKNIKWINKAMRGWQYATFKIKGQKHFRFSATWSLLGMVGNIMIGTGDNRYITKLRGPGAWIPLLLIAGAIAFFVIR